LSQQDLIDHQEKKIDSLHCRNRDLSNTVYKSHANCRDAKRAASRAEDNVADLLRQAEEVAIDERVREEVDIAKDKAEVRTL
jgi:hypothetical protein